MDSIKEIFDALNSRIRSPIFGSIALAFAAINWKALYFLIFANTTATARLEYFESNTSFWTAIFWPICAGLIFALASPWIALFSTWAAEIPTTRRKIRHARSAETLLREKYTLEQARLALREQQEDARIEAAIRDEKIKKISDPDIRGDLQREIEKFRHNSTISEEVSSIQNSNDADTKLEQQLSLIDRTIQSYKEEQEFAESNDNWDRQKQLENLITIEYNKRHKILSSRTDDQIDGIPY